MRALCAELPDHAFEGPVADCAGLAAAEAALRPGDRRGLARIEVAAHRVVLELVAAFGGDPRVAFAALASTPADAVVRARWPLGDQYPGWSPPTRATARPSRPAAGRQCRPGWWPRASRARWSRPLRARLAAEGFGAGAGDRFDGALVEALLRFQAARGVAGVARLDAPTREALAVPPAWCWTRSGRPCARGGPRRAGRPIG
ncbi:MAG: hypothetical protein H6704_05245 [Myxococcales bacterium]|nr:hypothetical protein [Myxococcales bacterium]